MLSKWLILFVVLCKVNSFGSNGEQWDEILSSKTNLENSRLSRQKSSTSYVSNPLTSTIEIPASVFPDVTYPTSILDTREPYYFTTNAFDDVLKPFSDDVKSSYNALKSGKIQSPSKQPPQPSKNNNNTLLIADASLNNCNELKESNETEFEKDILFGKDGGESILSNTTDEFDHKENEVILETNFSGILLKTEILEQDIQNTEENLTTICLNNLTSTNSGVEAIEELCSEEKNIFEREFPKISSTNSDLGALEENCGENENVKTEFPNKLDKARNIFNTILTTLQNFQKTGMSLSHSQTKNDYKPAIEIKNDVENLNNNTKTNHRFNSISYDQEKLVSHGNDSNSKVKIKEAEGGIPTEFNFVKDMKGDSSSFSNENEYMHIYVANENNSDFEIEILIDNREELNVKSAASSLSIFDF